MQFYTINIFASTAPNHWFRPIVDVSIYKHVLYLPISNNAVKSISIEECGEDLIDLLDVNNPRIQPLSSFDSKYKNSYEGYSKVRLGVYKKLLSMLEILPKDTGIAYFEGFRPLYKQKEYFDAKFREIYHVIKDKNKAYEETSKLVSPFIDNIPTHATGAAVDITLFTLNNEQNTLVDMGKFDVIFGPNDQQETFSENISEAQRQHRLMLLNAAIQAGLVNYGFEWWHYSYGDRAWAYVEHINAAIYGLAVAKDDPILSINKESYLESFEE